MSIEDGMARARLFHLIDVLRDEAKRPRRILRMPRSERLMADPYNDAGDHEACAAAQNQMSPCTNGHYNDGSACETCVAELVAKGSVA